MQETQEQVAHQRRDAGSWTLPARLPTALEYREGVAVITVRGDVDLSTSPLLREVLEPVLRRDSCPVVLDLSRVAFMDSTGVHALVDTFHRLEIQNRRLTIAAREDGPVHRVLDLLGLLELLPVRDSRESALTGAYPA